MENEISLKVFLFGSTHWVNNNPYNEIIVEGFDCLNTKSANDFEYFKSTVDCLCDLYGWDTESNTTVYLGADWSDHVQVFCTPSQEEMEELFEENKKRIENFNTNTINLNQFLFGGTHCVNNNSNNQIIIKPFKYLDTEEAKTNFDYFKKKVSESCNMYSWDKEQNLVLNNYDFLGLTKDYIENNVQDFATPNENEMMELFLKNKKRIENL